MTYQMNLHGRLTRDPEVKNGNSGPYARLSVAVNRKVKGEEITDYWTVMAFGRTGENASQYLKKGQWLFASGRPSFDVYERNTGEAAVGLTMSANDLTWGFEPREPREQAGGGWGNSPQRQQPQQPQQTQNTRQARGGWHDGEDPIPF